MRKTIKKRNNFKLVEKTKVGGDSNLLHTNITIQKSPNIITSVTKNKAREALIYKENLWEKHRPT